MLLALAALGVVAFATTVVVADDGAAASVLEAADVVAPVAQPEAAVVPEPVADQAAAAPQPVKRTVRYRRPAPKPMGPLARLWELEKRKNAWLKKTFLGI